MFAFNSFFFFLKVIDYGSGTFLKAHQICSISDVYQSKMDTSRILSVNQVFVDRIRSHVLEKKHSISLLHANPGHMPSIIYIFFGR